jgi:hypothetical protein
MYPVGCQFKTEKIYRLSSESAGLELSSVLENCPAFGTLWTGSDRIGSDRISGRRRVLQKVPAAAVGSFSRECMDVADGPGTLAERGPGGGIEIISPSVTATNYSTLV